MAKKCKGCGAPLEGFLAKISSLFGVKPSQTKPDYCNKCENKSEEKSETSSVNPVAPSIPGQGVKDTPAPVAPVAPVVEEEKKEVS